MKQREILTLKLIESLERDPGQTQRGLAKQLNVSLGLVNSFTRSLIKNEYFKIKSMPKNRVEYILTQKGINKKNALNYQYLLYSIELYKEIRNKMKSVFERLSEQGKKRIFLIGASELTEIALITLQESNLDLAGILDDEQAGNMFMGNKIMDYSRLKNVSSNEIAIITKGYLNKITFDIILSHIQPASLLDLRSTASY